MLEELRIRSLGVIDESVLELSSGFTAITGETGAGKTMVVTALGLLLGDRADAGAVRTGAKAARVEGVLALPEDDRPGSPAHRVDELGGEVEDGRVVLARQISAEGRSRAFAGGAAVPVSALSGLTDTLVAVHGQSDQHRLLQAAAQRESLDRFAGPEVLRLRAEYAATHRALLEAERELREIRDTTRERAQEADLLRFGLGEVEQVAPVVGEDQALAAEEERLGYADALRSAAGQAHELLSSEEGSGDALSAVASARRLLDGVREHDPEVAGLADRLAELSYLLADLAADVSSYATAVESDPARLAAVSERRAALAGLTRKYGDTLEAVLSWAEQSARRLLALDTTDERSAELAESVATLRGRLAELAAELSSRRTAAAGRLAEMLTAELSALAMRHARITVSVTQSEDPDGLDVAGRSLRFTAAGVDEVELLLAANRGAEPRPLAKGASGGELSRVMLAVEVVLAATRPVPTFVFDEVDAGVGGKAAVEVGRRLAMLARHAQVVVVTHLPQVAAFADHHVVVHKSDDGWVTASGLRVLDDEGRVKELSRMLAGLEDSRTALAHAEELLATAQEGRAGARH